MMFNDAHGRSDTMSAVKKTDYETILRAVRAWPLEQRFTLVQDVLKTLAPVVAHVPPPGNTLDQARGLLATDRPAPTDVEIAQWLDERRTERYER
jgi:hypothetical protein